MRIAYIKVGVNSYLNRAVEDMLRGEFPGHELVVYDITHDVLGGSLRAVTASAYFALQQYGMGALRNRNRLLNNFYSTGYFNAVRKKIRRMINPRDFVFSFQTQSLFDASVPGLPHFVYTDHTHLANMTYPGFDSAQLAPQEWIDREREIYANAAMVFTMSSNISQSLNAQYHLANEKVTCVYAGCSLKPDTQTMSTAAERGANILFTGRDWLRKGGPTLLQAFEIVRRKFPTATLTIIGSSPKTQIPANCAALGHVSRQKLIEAYNKAALFCLPTRMEPFGLAVLEAMSFGLPVVATDIGALPDMVEDGVNGHLVPPDDPTALAAGLDHVLANPDHACAMGEAGRQKIQNTYNWTNTGQLVKQAIDKHFLSLKT